MARLKIDYGIDLGTTNSVISRMDKGEPSIIKTDTLKDTMPSCVSFTRKKGVKVGDSAFNSLKSDKQRAFSKGDDSGSNAYIEFKRTMGSDHKYHSSNMGRDYRSEELSSEVLKMLKSFVLDENVKSAIITVPAKFTVNQKTATLEAATLAGIEHCELLQEPIAASMAYGLSASSQNGFWLVFDFGGGTFDAALVKVEDGIMQVFDTDGDNYLGGKNLDYAIVDKIFLPYLEENFELDSMLSNSSKLQALRDALKYRAEQLKNSLSFKDSEQILSDLDEFGEDDNGNEIELDLTVSRNNLHQVIRPIFQKAVDICLELLKRNNIRNDQLDKIILVGGPTHSSLIREMLKEQITPNVDTSIDPMTAVATGAALYASTIDNSISKSEIKDDQLVLDVGFESMSVETSEWVSITIKSGADQVWIEVVSADKSWASERTEISDMGNVVEVVLKEARANPFSIFAYDEQGNSLSCFPSEFTIIQGSKVGKATLPYNIGIERWHEKKKRGVFKAALGLEKNKPLPAIGTVNELRTTSDIRPGVLEDIIRIPIYQAEEQGEGQTASLHEYVSDVIITGDEIPALLPSGTEVNLTLKVDASEQMTLELDIPLLDVTISKELDTTKKQSVQEAEQYVKREIKNAYLQIEKLKSEGIDTSKLEKAIAEVQTELNNGTESKQVLSNLKKVLRKIEDIDDGSEWERLEKELRSEFDRLEKANLDLGNEESTELVNSLRIQVDDVIRGQNISMGEALLEQINSLYVHLTMLYQCIGFIRAADREFDDIDWSNKVRARELINTGLKQILSNPEVNSLQSIVVSIIELLPDSASINTGDLLR